MCKRSERVSKNEGQVAQVVLRAILWKYNKLYKKVCIYFTVSATQLALATWLSSTTIYKQLYIVCTHSFKNYPSHNMTCMCSTHKNLNVFYLEHNKNLH